MKTFPMPTVKEMNDGSDLRITLLLLRCLNTSDMGWTYMCLRPESLLDIVEMCRGFVDTNKENIASDFTPEEYDELLELCSTFEEYAKEHMS